MPKLLDEAREEFGLAILDAPPLPGFPEPLQMAASVDGVIVVTRAGQTERRAVAAVLNTLGYLRANVVGLVLNEVKKEMGSGYDYYGYGYYGKYSASITVIGKKTGSREFKISAPCGLFPDVVRARSCLGIWRRPRNVVQAALAPRPPRQ